MHVSSLSYLTESLLKQFKPSLFGKTYFVYEIYEDLQKSHHGSYCVIITYTLGLDIWVVANLILW